LSVGYEKREIVMKKWMVFTVMLLSVGLMFGEIGWCGNIWPNSGSTPNNDADVDVYFQIWKDGVTNSGGQGAGIAATLFYKESSQSSYSSVSMSYLGDVGNNDEYTAIIPVHILNMGNTVSYYCVAYDATDASSKTGNDQNGAPLNESSPGSLNISDGAAANGWFEDFLTISANGSSANYWIGSDPGSGSSLDGHAFGTVTSLSIDACDMKYWSNTNDRGGGAFYYEIRKQSDNSVVTSMTEVIWSQSVYSGNCYQGIKEEYHYLLGNTNPNTAYKLLVWAKNWDSGGGQGDSWLSNNSANYIATFTTAENIDPPLPISLASFSAAALNGAVSVTWVTESESENAHFLLYRDGEVLAQIAGAGTSSEPHSYAYTDQYVVPGKTYAYQLADMSLDGQETKHPRIEVQVKAEGIAQDYNIGSAYPNPFNPVTVVPVNLAKDATVRAVLYDLRGHAVKELINGDLSAGSHALKIDGAGLSTGIYFVRINIKGAVHVQKIALMK
jgi:hypothetical protein